LLTISERTNGDQKEHPKVYEEGWRTEEPHKKGREAGNEAVYGHSAR
jgi:hypothetical protein